MEARQLLLAPRSALFSYKTHWPNIPPCRIPQAMGHGREELTLGRTQQRQQVLITEADVEHFIGQSYIFISTGDEALRFLLGVLMFHFATYFIVTPAYCLLGQTLLALFLHAQGPPDNSFP